MTNRLLGTSIASLSMLLLFTGCSDGSDRVTLGPVQEVPLQQCAQVVPKTLGECLDAINTSARSCYTEGDASCPGDDSDVLGALNGLEDHIH